jgi:hypothetical protein
MKKRKMHGDVLRIDITPFGAGPAGFAWVKVFRHPYGIKYPASYGRSPMGVNARRDKSRRQLATEIGRIVIAASKNVLARQFPAKKD